MLAVLINTNTTSFAVIITAAVETIGRTNNVPYTVKINIPNPATWVPNLLAMTMYVLFLLLLSFSILYVLIFFSSSLVC